MPQFRLASIVKNTLEIKKSQFITWLVPIESKQHAKTFLEQARAEYPDARHYCWAYLIGENENSLSAAMSDDGEPSGTAGKPMLNVLQHKGVYNVMVIVVRYFGGIKLGAGGLVRAYSQAVEQSFNMATLVEMIPSYDINVILSFADEQWLRHQTTKFNGDVLSTNYSDQVQIKLKLPQEHFDTFKQTMDSKQIYCKIIT